MSPELERRWKVGELAKATGLTVRALHHYDDVGLLVPAERSSAGHRLYAEQDVRRLYRIVALRRLGLRLEEISAVLDDAGVGLLETVRRHLEQVEQEIGHHLRLRQQLRGLLEALERSAEPTVEQFIDTLEAMAVIEASVKDVLVWHSYSADPPPEQPQPHPPRAGQHAVLLQEHGGERVLTIWIGAPESHSLAAAISGRAPFRPMTPDLTASLLELSELRVERVVVESVRDHTFYAAIVVTKERESHEVDARPSDALNLAVRIGAPVFVAGELIDQAGALLRQLPLADAEVRSRLDTGARESPKAAEAGENQSPGEWRSVLAELRTRTCPRGRPHAEGASLRTRRPAWDHAARTAVLHERREQRWVYSIRRKPRRSRRR